MLKIRLIQMTKPLSAYRFPLSIVLLLSAFCLLLSGCAKEGNGESEPVGGDLPTNYIIITDSSFSPNKITAVRGNSFTFVNHSTATRGIFSADSMVINAQNIAVDKSFFFKKDTVGLIIYRMAGKPSVSGEIRLTN